VGSTHVKSREAGDRCCEEDWKDDGIQKARRGKQGADPGAGQGIAMRSHATGRGSEHRKTNGFQEPWQLVTQSVMNQGEKERDFSFSENQKMEQKGSKMKLRAPGFMVENHMKANGAGPEWSTVLTWSS
jgi:hypothetical protein